MKIYCAHPISGESYETVVGYYHELKKVLSSFGYDVMHPMIGKSYLRNEEKFKAEGYGNPGSTNRAILGRDKWMVRQCDVFYLNLEGSKKVSIGSMFELAWAHMLGKYCVVVMDDIHRHAFPIEASDVMFDKGEEALHWLEMLAYKIT